MDARLEKSPVGVITVAPDGSVEDVNSIAHSVLEFADEVYGTQLTEIFPRSVKDSIIDAFEGEYVTETSFEEYYPTLEKWLDIAIVSTADGRAVFVQDVTEQRQHEQSIGQLQTTQKRTAIIESVLSDILAELTAATSREEIAETVCRSLGETEIFEFAWAGEREIGGEGLDTHTAAGNTGETYTAIQHALTDESVTTLEERAVASGQLQTAQPLTDSAEVPESVWKAGFADGVQSAIAIPFVYGSTALGVVGVYASGTDAFSDRERTSFETLGEIAGFAVSATRNRNLLLSDTVTKLTFDIGPNSALYELSQVLDSTLVLDGLVPHEDAALLCFIAIEDTSAQSVKDATFEIDGIASMRPIRETGQDIVVELEIQGFTPLLEVSSLGGTVRSAYFDSGSGQIVVELPTEADIRRIADTVSRKHDVEFVAKEEQKRSVTTAREFRDAVDDRLTERQHTVLQTAYLADYFESPRGSTAEEVAKSLGITGSTLLHHLRAGQRKLLDAYLVENRQNEKHGRD